MSSAYLEEEAVVNAGRTTTVDLRLRPLAAVRGFVENLSTDSLLKGVRIQLQDSTGRLVQESTTGDDGSYRFSGLHTGAYVVKAILPKGYLHDGDAEHSFEITGGGEVRFDFRVYRHGAITGHVTTDAGTPMVDAEVSLVDSTGAVIRTAKTDHTGFYIFNDVPVDKYKIRADIPENYSA